VKSLFEFKRLQREALNPLGAFTFDHSGKSFSSGFLSGGNQIGLRLPMVTLNFRPSAREDLVKGEE
jgi:hypothetical protein